MLYTNNQLKQKLDKEIALLFRNTKSEKINKLSAKSVTYKDFLSNKMLIIAMIRQGVPYSLFNLIQNTTPFSESDWAMILDISTKSLQRYKQSDRNFKPLQSEKIIEIAEVTEFGLKFLSDC